MIDSLSPYALLQASKPRQPKVVTTAYDLFSAAQSSPAPTGNISHELSHKRTCEAVSAAPKDETPSPSRIPAASMPLVPKARTHYISDIKRRHSEALRRACPPPP